MGLGEGGGRERSDFKIIMMKHSLFSFHSSVNEVN